MNNIVRSFLIVIATASALLAQALTSLNGTVIDPTGAVVPGALISLHDIQRGVVKSATSNEAGRYSFAQIQPGTYRLEAKVSGFRDVVIENIKLQVSTPATINVALQTLREVSEAITVTAETTQVNAVDASVGNAIGSSEIGQLPFPVRNVAGLLAFQSGVTSFSQDTGDDRNGSVNGGRSDQANITLDGVDVNDQSQRKAFTTVLRVTLDSISEFRTTTTGANADQGRSSGAQVALVTKSGTNSLHGSLYDYHRNTVTAANSWFNNASGIPRPALLIDVFGGSLGGPVKKNRAFYFFNYEGRQDRSATTVSRTVPSDTLRQGILQYQSTSGSVVQLTPNDLKTRIDPAGIGVSQAMLNLFAGYPKGNDFSGGDGLNSVGYRFTAPQPSRYNTYISRLDYIVDQAGKHTISLRGNLQNDKAVGAPQFEGQEPNSVHLNNSKGISAGYNAILRQNLFSTTRFGFTRQGFEDTGLQHASAVNLSGLNLSPPVGVTTAGSRIIPVYQVSEDLAWNRGVHEIRFGGVARWIRNGSLSNANSFHSADMWPGWLVSSGAELNANLPDLDPDFTQSYRDAAITILGIVPRGTASYNYGIDGKVLPVDTPIARDFASNEYEMYAQDTWKVSPGFTVSAGLRYSLMPPVYEVNGLQTSTSISWSDWLNKRGALADQGLSQAGVGRVSYVPSNAPGGAPLYPFYKKNFAPRLAIAWSPQSTDGIIRFLTGGPGKTSIRAGWGMFYDIIGQPLMQTADASAYGFTANFNNPPSTLTMLTTPRFTGIFDVPPQLIGPAPPGGFPREAPLIQAGSVRAVDSALRQPYNTNTTFSFGREFGKGLFIQGSYVGRKSRRSLILKDFGVPTNLKDPASGVTYYQAAADMLKLWRAGVPVSQVKPQPYWEDFFPAGDGLTATQRVYNSFVAHNVDTTSVLWDLDVLCQPMCSKLGPFAFFNEQFSGVAGWSSIGKGDYHSMQWTVRQRLGRDLRFDLNYTWSKSIDLVSATERSRADPDRDILETTWTPGRRRGVSDYDVTHMVNAFAIWELPFGKGKKFLSSKGGPLDLLFGGWQLAPSWNQSSGLPASVFNGTAWPTSWFTWGFATQTGVVPQPSTTKNAPAISGRSGPNIWSDPLPAHEAYTFSLPGEGGQRTGIRGDGAFNINLGVSKRFIMPYREGHSLQFRWEIFNLTNSVRFDIQSAKLNFSNTGSFGKYRDTLSRPREMQFALRYEF